MRPVTTRPIPRVLSIAGTDPTGGAGLHADLKSILAAGGYGMGVVTALVAQNTQGVRSVHVPPIEFLTQQLDSVSDDIGIDAIKIGMLGNAEIAHTVAQWLERIDAPVVLDPVMVATSGHRLLDSEAEEVVTELAREATIITPNLPELSVLCGKELTTAEDALHAAQEFAAESQTLVVVKGGHLSGPEAGNWLVSADSVLAHTPSPRISTKNTHGTGCSLSAALATKLAQSGSPEAALEWSTRWLHDAIAAADHLDVGKGNGPIDHGVWLR
ncbi:bifunctional hydroxymethylpyrimidine kinase/phosphomethylpyrimidine kinase [Corynebacterium epidermidicanis]|uniref:Thiamine biosynthesis multifunctional protein ThiED n=1 Tax=Corynebacterium epidermidicanis TaxID=1050174 RepID=A0A0G3GU60_9CORY|nr:bifunctional hydroxymethylpyrimidine kinase/phosphomethylpyrimidine kinase [Corynebacterium epidermidicanis]AKK03098.1 hydroxymethylpyrimidine kinase/phosphomethylpyrimidine kinase [Corynebacterium epidermidicanis]